MLLDGGGKEHSEALEQALANGSAEILQNKYDTLQNLDNAYAQQILALQQAAAQAAQKRW